MCTPMLSAWVPLWSSLAILCLGYEAWMDMWGWADMGRTSCHSENDTREACAGVPARMNQFFEWLHMSVPFQVCARPVHQCQIFPLVSDFSLSGTHQGSACAFCCFVLLCDSIKGGTATTPHVSFLWPLVDGQSVRLLLQVVFSPLREIVPVYLASTHFNS